MRKHYDLVLIDGSYFIYRNQSIMRNAPSNKLTGSVIQTLRKLLRGVASFDVGFLAIDYGPYHRTAILNGKYKDNRDKFTQSDIDNVETQLECDSLTEGERVRLINSREHMIDEIRKMNVRLDTVSNLTHLSKFGITTLTYLGWEADDISRLVIDLYPNKSILLISIDSDWVGNVSDNVDYLRVRHKGVLDFYNTETIKNYVDYVRMENDGLTHLGLRRYLEIMESMGIGHNNMRPCWKDPIIMPEIIDKWDDLDSLKESHGFDVDTFKLQLSTFDIKSFPDYDKVKDDILNTNLELHPLSEFDMTFLYKLGTGINKQFYKPIYDRIRNYSML